jgi:hypothetical protein
MEGTKKLAVNKLIDSSTFRANLKVDPEHPGIRFNLKGFLKEDPEKSVPLFSTLDLMVNGAHFFKKHTGFYGPIEAENLWKEGEYRIILPVFFLLSSSSKNIPFVILNKELDHSHWICMRAKDVNCIFSVTLKPEFEGKESVLKIWTEQLPEA